jgi:cytochrome c55X
LRCINAGRGPRRDDGRTEGGSNVEAVRSPLIAGALALAAAVVAVGAAAEPPDPARQRELTTLLKQDCGSCHGMRLTGGLGPPLTRDALRDRPHESLAATIQHGRPGTAMPPWRRFLSDADAAWLAARLIEGVE